MTCPHCRYALSAFDKTCPRCQKDPAAPVESVTSPTPVPVAPQSMRPTHGVAPLPSPSHSPYSGSQAPVIDNSDNSSLSIASMILGIVSLVFMCVWYISFPCSILAVVLGGIAIKNNYGGKGMAIAGLTTGIIGLVATAIVIIWIVGLASAIGSSAAMARPPRP